MEVLPDKNQIGTPTVLRPNTAVSSLPSSPSSISESTARDIESQNNYGANDKVTFFRTLVDQSGITQQVLNHKYAGDGTIESPYQVTFLPNDPYDAARFPASKKWAITFVQAVGTLSVAFASSAYSGGVLDLMKDFRVDYLNAILGVSMFVLGFAVGPLMWGPLSEIYGRQKLFFITHMGITAFSAGAAAAPNMNALIVLRFFAGAFGSSPLTNAGAVIADMFEAKDRGIAGSMFALAPFLGPAIGPIAGGFLGEAAGWRWVQGMICIFSGCVWLATTLTYPETYAPVLLRKRAEALSKKTGDVYVSMMEVGQPAKTLRQQFSIALSRPWVLLIKEPIVLLTSIYMAIIYGTLYLCFAAFPIVFQMGRGWSPGVGGLAFIGLAVGMILSVMGNIVDNKRYIRVAAAHGGMAPPEARLPPAIVGSFLIPAGMFWFAWTSGPEIHWVVPIIGSALFGGGIMLVFLSLITYLMECYVIFAASVLAANSVLRSLFGMAFPLFTSYMYEDLGVHWASSIPAFLAVACIPFPILFYKYGAQIRMKCQYASEAAAVLKKMMAQRAAVGTEDHDMAEIERKMTGTLTA